MVHGSFLKTWGVENYNLIHRAQIKRVASGRSSKGVLRFAITWISFSSILASIKSSATRLVTAISGARK